MASPVLCFPIGGDPSISQNADLGHAVNGYGDTFSSLGAMMLNGWKKQDIYGLNQKLLAKLGSVVNPEAGAETSWVFQFPFPYPIATPPYSVRSLEILCLYHPTVSVGLPSQFRILHGSFLTSFSSRSKLAYSAWWAPHPL